MRNILSSVIVASALVIGGSAFASGDGPGNISTATTVSQNLTFNAQAKSNKAAPDYQAFSLQSKVLGATSQGFAPVDTNPPSFGR